MKYGNAILTVVRGILLNLLLSAGVVATSLGATSFQLYNAGSCTITNLKGRYVVTSQTGVSGTLTSPQDSTTVSTAPGATLQIGSVALTGGQSMSVNIFYQSADTGGSWVYLGNWLGSVGSTVLANVTPSNCGTGCVTGTFTATVNNRWAMWGIGIFKMNGLMQQSSLVAPGASVSYTYTWCTTNGTPAFQYGMSFNESGVIDDGNGDMVVNNTSSGATNDVSPSASDNFSLNNTTNAYSNSNVPKTGGFTNLASLLTNNAPINWNIGDTTAARDATLRAGFNKIAIDMNGELLATMQLHTDLLGVSNAVANSGGGGSSNYVSVIVTNNIGGFTNDALTSNQLAGMLSTYQLQLGTSNLFAGTNIAATGLSVWSSLNPSATWTTPTELDPGEAAFSIPIAGAITFDVDTSVLPGHAVFTFARTMVKWSVVILTMFQMFKWAEKAVFGVLQQRQVEGNQQEILGVNLDVPTALAYIAVIAVLLASIPLVLVAYFSGTAGEASSLYSTIVSGAATHAVGWAFANYIVPVSVIITAFFTYASFRFVVGVPLMFGLRLIIFSMFV